MSFDARHDENILRLLALNLARRQKNLRRQDAFFSHPLGDGECEDGGGFSELFVDFGSACGLVFVVLEVDGLRFRADAWGEGIGGRATVFDAVDVGAGAAANGVVLVLQ